jgi:hypothetical protein
VHQKGDFDARGFGGCEDLVCVCVRSDQAVTFHNHPLIRIPGTIFLNPRHLTASITGRDHSDWSSLLQSVREAKDFLLLRRWKALSLILQRGSLAIGRSIASPTWKRPSCG